MKPRSPEQPREGTVLSRAVADAPVAEPGVPRRIEDLEHVPGVLRRTEMLQEPALGAPGVGVVFPLDDDARVLQFPRLSPWSVAPRWFVLCSGHPSVLDKSAGRFLTRSRQLS